MEIQVKLKELSDRIIQLKDQITTEEGTKNAFIMPFISLLGYDIFNPLEVVPEFTADIGLKKGEKVDYAIFQNGNPILIIECKHWHENLNVHNSQLFRYFHVTKTRFALLTNGIDYRFYSDLEETNKMDEKPFLEFNLTELKDSTINEITKFHKSNFDVDSIISNASSLKYIKEIKKIIVDELTSPTDDFVRHFASQAYSGKLMKSVIEDFRDLVQKAFSQIISERVNDRLQNALRKETEKQVEEKVEPVEISKIDTTEEELDGFRIVVAILRRRIDVKRITHRDTQSYFGVLLDDNNRKPLCRLHFNTSNKYITLFDTEKQGTKILLEKIEDIYNYETQLLSTLDIYENSSEEH